MVVSIEWARWGESKENEGKSVRQRVLNDDWWWEDYRYLVMFMNQCHYCRGPLICIQILVLLDIFVRPFTTCWAKLELPFLRETIHYYSLLSRFNKSFNGGGRRWPLHMVNYVVNPKWSFTHTLSVSVVYIFPRPFLGSMPYMISTRKLCSGKILKDFTPIVLTTND